VSQLEFTPLNDIREQHLQSLIDNNVPESRTLEFKKEAVGANENDKREFLKDTTALANTAGGILIYGMAENDGVAYELKALTVSSSIDDEILRLQSSY
jgi:predicted HTH transcriptional regulator